MTPQTERLPISCIVSVGLCFDGASNERKMLVQCRPAKGLRGGLWEFPGGKVERGETLREAVVREWKEELGVVVRPLGYLTDITLDYPEAPNVRLVLFRVSLNPGETPKAQLGPGHRWAWKTLPEIEAMDNVPSFPLFLPFLREYLGCVCRFGKEW